MSSSIKKERIVLYLILIIAAVQFIYSTYWIFYWEIFVWNKTLIEAWNSTSEINKLCFILSLILFAFESILYYKVRIERVKVSIKCNVCGHLISENETECPYCHQIIKKETEVS
jgi:predicted membrane protein